MDEVYFQSLDIGSELRIFVQILFSLSPVVLRFPELNYVIEEISVNTVVLLSALQRRSEWTVLLQPLLQIFQNLQIETWFSITLYHYLIGD